MFDKLGNKARQTFLLEPGLHLEGNRELLIENCRRIEEYNEVLMRLISGRFCIQVWGSGLRAYDYRTRGLVIRGKISRIELVERSAGRHERPASGLH